MESQNPARVNRPRVVHVTTAHVADDVRIFERECRSLASSGLYDVNLAAAGSIPGDTGVTLIPLTRVPGGRARRFSSGPWKGFAVTSAVAADLWHFHDPELLPVAINLTHFGRRVVWDAHEDYIAQFTEAGGKPWVPAPVRGLVRNGTAALLHAIDKSAAGVIAATPSIAMGYRNPRTVIVGNEARLQDFEDCRPHFEARRVLFTGSVGSGHLFFEVVEAIVALPNVRLTVAGRPPDAELWSRAEGRLGSRITHLGWLDRAALALEISRSSLGLSTYADLATNAVNAPNKMFEFGAAGLPVVATPTRSNADFAAQGAGVFLAAGFGAKDLQEAIHGALEDRDAWLVASSSGREWAAREGSWTASEGRLLSLYAAILGDSGTRR